MLDHQSYLHSEYGNSFQDSYSIIRLKNSQALIFKRPIHDTGLYDLMGAYPLLFCGDWKKLHIDLEDNMDNMISFTAVTDPFGEFNITDLKKTFNTLVVPFKDHFVTDLSLKENNFINKHNRRYSKKALNDLTIEVVKDPLPLLDKWCNLYSNLVKRNNIKGIANFSEESLKRQMKVPNSVIFCAKSKGKVVGITIWYMYKKIAYYHLGAYSDFGYEKRASYAIFWKVIEYFRHAGFSWLSLGAGAGVNNDGTDGLSRFKKGWSTGTKTTYLCGHIFDQKKYKKLSISRVAEKLELNCHLYINNFLNL